MTLQVILIIVAILLVLVLLALAYINRRAVIAWIKSEPLLSTGAGITSLAGAIIALLPDFGIHLSASAITGITGIAGIVALLLGRQLVTSNATAADRIALAHRTPPDQPLPPS